MRALDAQLDFNLPFELACEISRGRSELSQYITALGPERCQYDLLNRTWRLLPSGRAVSLGDLKRAAEEGE